VTEAVALPLNAFLKPWSDDEHCGAPDGEAHAPVAPPARGTEVNG
jgi:hypothetical protein